MKMNKKEHLPIYGVGPIYGVSIMIITLIGIVLSVIGVLDAFKVSATRIPFMIIGIFIIVFGFWVWYKGAFKIDKYITSNELCTDGIYAWVRNPCYSGIMLMCTGALFIANNLILLILPFVYWIYMTILMKNTEEKWLINLYGDSYVKYCKQVNRCIPFFRKHSEP